MSAPQSKPQIVEPHIPPEEKPDQAKFLETMLAKRAQEALRLLENKIGNGVTVTARFQAVSEIVLGPIRTWAKGGKITGEQRAKAAQLRRMKILYVASRLEEAGKGSLNKRLADFFDTTPEAIRKARTRKRTQAS